MQNKVLIANRGEIAVRIIRACKELGIACVAIYSKADENSLHVKLADQAICIGEAKSRDSYLNINNIISAAIATGCNAIHPGYGFLAENEKFVEIIEKCGIKFIGPSSKVMKEMGNKVKARQIAKRVGLNVIEGSDNYVSSLNDAITIANQIGYPLLIKAVCGGGGRGIEIVENEEALIKSFNLCCHEAEINFGDNTVYLEKYLPNARHIEIQILADSFGNTIHLGERDCSIQRRNQKTVEEAPSPFINDKMRMKMGEDAVRLAKAIKYENAGTVEFIVDHHNNYYFIEMNTRIQVEHPVTEMVTGIDIVKQQLRIAYNLGLDITQDDVLLNGHAIECRINAEDPINDFKCSPGEITHLLLPGGMGVRIDTHIYNQYQIPPYYDSMLAKLIVHAPTRKEAIRKMRVALEQLIIDGVKTNIELQYLLMHNTDYVRGFYDTSFLMSFVELVKEKR